MQFYPRQSNHTGREMKEQGRLTQAGGSPSTGNAAERLLLHRVAAEEYDAFRELYALYFPRLHGFVSRLTRQNELIEEIINDVMLVVWQQAGKFKNQSKVSTWVFGIAYRKTLKTLQRQAKGETCSIGDLPEMVDPDSPDTLLAREQLVLHLQQMLQKLSFEQRAVIELTYVYGYSYPEIAAMTGCPVNTVKTRMFHARKRLKELLPQHALSHGKHQTDEVPS